MGVNMRNKIILPLLCLLLASCSGPEQVTKAAPKDALVTFAVSEQADVPVFISAVGSVIPSSTVTVISRTGGELMETHFKAGDYVKEGQLLFTLDKVPAQLALDELTAKIDADKARLAKAEDDLQRSQKLTSGGFTSADQNDQARLAAVGARATVRADEVLLEKAKLNLSYCDITAPISGKAGLIQVDNGNIVAAGQQPLVVIDTISPIQVTFSIPERHLLYVRGLSENSDLKVYAQPKAGDEQEGLLTFIGNVDVRTGTIPLRSSFENTNSLLWPGEFVRVRLQLATIKNATAVPSQAIAIGPKGPFVYVVQDDMTVRYQSVETGVETDGVTVITKGLNPGEKVVLEGHVRLTDGKKVRFTEEQSKQPDGQAKPASPEGADGATS